MRNMFGRLPDVSTLLDADGDVGTTLSSQAPVSSTTASAAAVITQSPFSSPPSPLYLHLPPREAAGAIGPFWRSLLTGADNQSTDSGAFWPHHGAPAGVGHCRNTDDSFHVFAGDQDDAHTNFSEDGFPSGGSLLYRSRDRGLESRLRRSAAARWN